MDKQVSFGKNSTLIIPHDEECLESHRLLWRNIHFNITMNNARKKDELNKQELNKQELNKQ